MICYMNHDSSFLRVFNSDNTNQKLITCTFPFHTPYLSHILFGRRFFRPLESRDAAVPFLNDNIKIVCFRCGVAFPATNHTGIFFKFRFPAAKWARQKFRFVGHVSFLTKIHRIILFGRRTFAVHVYSLPASISVVNVMFTSFAIWDFTA